MIPPSCETKEIVALTLLGRKETDDEI